MIGSTGEPKSGTAQAGFRVKEFIKKQRALQKEGTRDKRKITVRQNTATKYKQHSGADKCYVRAFYATSVKICMSGLLGSRDKKIVLTN